MAIEYAQQRFRYRIGERLRPCVCAACDPRATHTVEMYIMQPWGWPRPRTHYFKQVAIPAGSPCQLLADGRYVKVRYFVEGQAKVALMERQYLCILPVRICDGSGVLPAKRRAGGR